MTGTPPRLALLVYSGEPKIVFNWSEGEGSPEYRGLSNSIGGEGARVSAEINKFLSCVLIYQSEDGLEPRR